MTARQFHEGQEVEVHTTRRLDGTTIPGGWHRWRKATIVESHGAGPATKSGVYSVLFPDGTRDAFGAEQIRTIEPQHDAHIDAYWQAARAFVRMQTLGYGEEARSGPGMDALDASMLGSGRRGNDPFTGKPEFAP